MEPHLKLSKESDQPGVDQTEYMSIVGCLRYLVNTRPDIAFVVGYVSRFLENPKEDHMTAVKHIVRYVTGTKNWGLWFSRREEEVSLTGFNDSDYASDVDKRKNITRVIFFLADSPITWQSMKRKVVVQSSCEAEYIAAANATCQALWLSQVLADVQGTKPRVSLLNVDNKSAIALIKNPVLIGQSKYIEVKYHLVWRVHHEGRSWWSLLEQVFSWGIYSPSRSARTRFRSSQVRSISSTLVSSMVRIRWRMLEINFTCLVRVSGDSLFVVCRVKHFVPCVAGAASRELWSWSVHAERVVQCMPHLSGHAVATFLSLFIIGI
jgi:hypothetical protein